MPHTTTRWIDLCSSCGQSVVLVFETAQGDDRLPIRQAWTCPACNVTQVVRLPGEVIAVRLLDAIDDEIAPGRRQRLPHVS